MYLPTSKLVGIFRHSLAILFFSLIFNFSFLIFNLGTAYAVPNDATNYLQNWSLQGGGNASDATTSLSSTDYKIINSTLGEIIGGSPKSNDSALACDPTGNGICKIQPGFLYTRTKFATSGNFVSTNLLSGTAGESIDSFIFNLPSLPTGTTAALQFSQDKSTWVNSAGTANASNTLSTGVNTVSLATLGWTTPNFYYKVNYTGPGTKTPSLETVSLNYGATSAKLRPIFVASSTDPQSDYLRYKVELCTDLAMTQNCQTFDQTASQTGWSQQDTQTSTAYKSGTQAYYLTQADLAQSTTYYWRASAIDPAGSNAWSAASSVSSFTTGIAGAPTNCDIAEIIAPNQVRLTWTDNATIEDNHLVERSLNAGIFSQIASLNPNTATYTDTLSSAGTYRYRMRVVSSQAYSNYCTVIIPVVYPFANIKFEGIKFERLKIK